MAEPFLSEIRLMSFGFPPKGWALCNGQLLPINQNQALFSLLGTTYGGDGQTNFALPDLRGRVPIHVGAGHTLGERGGAAGPHAVARPRCRSTRTSLQASSSSRQHAGADGKRPRGQPERALRPPADLVPMQPDVGHERGRLSGPPQHAAVPDPELLHRAAGHLPVTELGGSRWHSPTSARSGCSAGNFAPDGWMFCDGQLIPISENDTLFTLIGTTYGGDGEETFALPDLRGRLPIHLGNGFILAETGGAEEITLTVQPDPVHGHPLLGTNNSAPRRTRGGNVPARFSQANISPYIEDVANAEHGADRDRAGRREPAAHQLPALPLHQLHHLAVRDLPVADLGETMADPFVAEIRIFPFNFPPTGWAFCDGQLLPLRQNTALFSLLGTTYGGDGKSNFALPDLQGNAPMHPGQGPGLRCTISARAAGTRDRHAARERDPGPHPRAAGATAARPGDTPLPGGTRSPRPADAVYQTTPTPNLVTMAPEALPRPAAASPTTTCSRI